MNQCTDGCPGTKQLFAQDMLVSFRLQPPAQFDNTQGKPETFLFTNRTTRPQPITFHLPPITYYLLPITFYLLPFTFYLLLTFPNMETMLETSQLAVPINAPSQPGTAKISAIFCGLTLPP